MLNKETHSILIQKGNEAIFDLDYASAIKYFGQALEESEDPNEKKSIIMSLDIAKKKIGCISNLDYECQDDVDDYDSKDEESNKTITQKLTEYSSKFNLRNRYERGECFGQNKFYDKAIRDLKFCASLGSTDPLVYNQLVIYGIQIKDFDLCEKAIQKLEEMNYEVFLLKGKVNIAKQKYNDAEQDVKELVERGDYYACSMIALLYFFYYGNASKAFSVLNVVNEQEGLYPFESTIQYILHLFTQPEIPNTILDSSLYSGFLMHLINGIYSSLAIPIVSVPGDLFIPKSVQKAWMQWDTNFKCHSFPKLSYPDVFDFSLKDFQSFYQVFNKALIIGTFINQSTKNTRERICLGSATIQIKNMLSNPLSLDMDIAVSSVIHWIRLYDPLSPIFQRDSTPFVVYFQKNGVKAGNESFYNRAFDMLKKGIIETVTPTWIENIKKAETPNEIYEIIRSNSLVPISKNIYLFLRFGKNNGVDMGIAIPPLSLEFREDYSSLSAIWARLMILMKTNPTNEHISEFINCLFLWYYRWLQLSPYAYHSQTIGIVLFISLFTEYLGVEITDNLPYPHIFHIEALLSPNFEKFVSQIKQSYPISFEYIDENDHLPDIIELMPTYHHRIQGILIIDSFEFRSFYINQLKKIAEQIANYTNNNNPLNKEQQTK